MESIIENLSQNDWWKWVTLVVTIASAIAATTPTPKKGSKWALLYKAIDWASINIGKAKETGEEEEEEEEDKKSVLK